MNKLMLLSAFLFLCAIACSFSEQAIAAPVPIAATQKPITPTLLALSAYVFETPSKQREVCVTSYGLWLRSEPRVADNEIMALPQKTKLLVIYPGTWSWVYLKSYDVYGYVKTEFTGECK